MRYFNKSFFKFTLGFLIIIAISLFIIYAASAYAAGVEKIVFTTDLQTDCPWNFVTYFIHAYPLTG